MRSLSPRGARLQQERVLDRLERLRRDSCIDSFTVTVWGTGVSPTSAIARTEAGQATLETIDELQQWAQQNDLSFPAGFKPRKIVSMLDDERDTFIPFPTMCLAVREGNELQCVAPCVNDMLTHSIRDCLDELVVGERRSDVHNWSPPQSSAD